MPLVYTNRRCLNRWWSQFWLTRRSPSAEMDRWVAMRFPCGFTQRLAKTGPWNYGISGFLIQFNRRQLDFFSPIGMYTISAHWYHIIHARFAHSKLKLDIKNACIDIVQYECQGAKNWRNWLFSRHHLFLMQTSCQTSHRATFNSIGNHC